MKTRMILTMTGVVALGGILWTRTAAVSEEPAKVAEVGQSAPDFELKDVFGKTFKLSDFKDHIVVLEWMNQDCPVTQAKQKDKTMQKTYAKYAGKGVIWLGIDSTHSQTAEKNRIYAAEAHLNYPVLHDPEGKTGKAYGAKTTPHMYVIDKKGTLAYTGAIDDKGEKNYVALAIDDLLADKAVGTAKTQPYGCGVKYKK